jgi:hypothetical protein
VRELLRLIVSALKASLDGMRTTLLAAAAFIVLGSATGTSAASSVTLKLEQFRRSVAFRVDVGGKERLFQFDTGGGISFISPEIAKELSCEKGAQVVGFRMTGDKLVTPRCDNVRLSIGGKQFTIPLAGVAQLGELNAKDVTIDGMIALDVFAGRTITLDFAGKRVIIETPASAAIRKVHGTELPMHMVREIGGYGLAAHIDVPSKMGPLGFELDSGNGGTLLIAKPYAAVFGLDAAAPPREASLPIGPDIVAHGFVVPADITLDGNLGMPFLKDYLVTLDLKAGRAWFARNPVPAPPGMGEPPPPQK